jgi:hypothetical protein
MDFDEETRRMKDRAFKKELEFQRKLHPDADKDMQERNIRKKIYGSSRGGGAMLDLTQRPGGMRMPPKKKFKEGKKVKRKLPKTPTKAQRARGPEAGMAGFGTAQPESIAKRVKPGLASGVRGTPKNPVGGPETVGMLERLTGKARKKAPKVVKDVEKKVGAALGYESGGKIRGCGMASKGTRPVKMVRMKGS